MTATDIYAVPCLAGRSFASKHITVAVPGSKSITNRALLLAMLADGRSTLTGALFSDDSRNLLKCLQELGFTAWADEEAKTITVDGLGGKLPKQEASLYVGSAGTAARFLSACLGVSHGVFHMDASEQMRRRPMAPLLASLRELGCEIVFEEAEGHFPFTLKGHGFGKQDICVDIESSSQFLSALLIASALSPRDMRIRLEGTHGMAYIDMTCRMMAQFGVDCEKTSACSFTVPAGKGYRAREYAIEPDASAAAYFYALGALTGCSVTVDGVAARSLQGDVAFLSFLEQMGCSLRETPQGLCLSAPADGILRGITADMSACSDQAITLAAIAPFADSPVTITGIGHIRHQESDRLSAIVENLNAMGIRCEQKEDGITVYPGTPRPALIHTYDDHRLAMGFALTGLRAEGIVIENPLCCKKTFENYFDVLNSVIASLRA